MRVLPVSASFKPQPMIALMLPKWGPDSAVGSWQYVIGHGSPMVNKELFEALVYPARLQDLIQQHLNKNTRLDQYSHYQRNSLQSSIYFQNRQIWSLASMYCLKPALDRSILTKSKEHPRYLHKQLRRRCCWCREEPLRKSSSAYRSSTAWLHCNWSLHWFSLVDRTVNTTSRSDPNWEPKTLSKFQIARSRSSRSTTQKRAQWRESRTKVVFGWSWEESKTKSF